MFITFWVEKTKPLPSSAVIEYLDQMIITCLLPVRFSCKIHYNKASCIVDNKVLNEHYF